MDFTIHSIGTVINDRLDLSDDYWGDVVSEIKLDPSFTESALDGIEEFSHLEIVFVFHKSVNDSPHTGAAHPRDNERWPRTGIFAQRKKNRPNFIGTAMATLIKKAGTSLFVRDLDAINGTPVIDIKPVMRKFLPRGAVRQPDWAAELMKNYWGNRSDGKNVPIILKDFLRAVDDHCDFACYYLDRETGEIIFQSERDYCEETINDDAAGKHGGERFIPIEPMESPRGLEAMNGFIRTLPESPAARELSRTLSMRKPFKRFKDALHNHPDLEAQWRAFSKGTIEAIADEWLHHNGIDYTFVALDDLLKRHE